MTANTDFQLVLRKTEDYNLGRLASILGPALKKPQQDITTHLRRNFGFVHRSTDAGVCQAAQAALVQAGIETFLLAPGELRPLPAVEQTRRAVPEPAGLVLSHDNQKETVPWSCFVMLCAGQFEQTITSGGDSGFDYDQAAKNVVKGALRGGLVGVARQVGKASMARATAGSGTKTELQVEYWLDLVDAKQGRTIRMVGSRFDYSFLAARKAYALLQNFRQTVTDFAGHLPGALKNRGAKAIQSGPTLRDLKYDSDRAYQQEQLWLLQLVGRS